MILVIGANGRIGRLVVEELSSRYQILPRIMVRDEQAARSRFGADIEITLGDLGDQVAVECAMLDVDAVFLCSPVHPDQIEMHGNVIRAAAQRNTHIIKLSGLETHLHSYVDSGRWHAITEQQIRDDSIPFTFLHPNFFTQNLAFQFPSAKEQGVIRSAVPQAAIAMVDVRDIAAVAAKVLANPDLALNQTLKLTNNKAVCYEDIASMLSSLLKKTVTYESQNIEQVEKALRNAGQPEWHIQILLQFNRAFNEDLGSQVDPALEDILGRQPIEVMDSLQYLLAAELNDSNPFPS